MGIYQKHIDQPMPFVGWVLCTARRTVTGMLPFADPVGRHAHDAYHRFFPDRRLANPEKMASYVRDWKLVEFCLRSKRVKRLVYIRQVLWYGVCRKPTLLVLCRDPEGKEKDDFSFTTDVTMDATKVLKCYGDRWDIEDTFKNTKQFLGGQEPQTWKRQGPERAAALSLWLYVMVWLWYLKRPVPKRWFRVQPWQHDKTTPNFADALACLRYELWQEKLFRCSENLPYMIKNSSFCWKHWLPPLKTLTKMRKLTDI